MLPFLFAVLLAVHPAPGERPDEPRAVVDALIDALRRSDVETASRLFIDEDRALIPRKKLIDLLETYDCVSVRSLDVIVDRVEEDAVHYAIELDASAVTRGRSNPARYPRRWLASVRRTNGQWRLERAGTREREAAIRLSRDSELTEEKVFAAADGLDLERVLRDIADELTDHPLDRQQEKMAIAENIARERGLILAEVDVIRGRAIVELAPGHYDRAEPYAVRALSLALASGLPDAIGMAMLTAGTNAWLRGERHTAISRYETAAQMLERLDDPRPAMKSLYMHALLLQREGNLSEALVLAGRVADAAERFDWTEGRLIAALRRAEIYMHLQETAIARDQSVTALRYARVLRNPPMIASAIFVIATTERAAGNPQATLKLLEDLLPHLRDTAVSHSVRASIRLELAAALSDLGRFDEAEKELLQTITMSRTASERGAEAVALSALARLRLKSGNAADALQAADEADDIVRDRTGSVAVGVRGVDEWSIRGTLGIALAANGHRDAAIAALQSSVAMIEARRAKLGIDEIALSGFLQGKDEPYRALVRLLIDAGRDRDALLVSERLRARALGTAIAHGNIDVLPNMTPEESKRLDALNADIATLNKQLLASDAAQPDLHARLDETRTALRALMTDLYARSPAVRARASEDPQTIVDDPLRLLPKSSEALLTFLVDDEQTFAFLIHRDAEGMKIVSKRIAVTRSELTRIARRLTTAFGARSLSYRNDSRRLHDLLLSPFLPAVRTKRLLYIVPDGILWRVPFHALQAKNGQHLIEKVAVAYTPSLTLLRTRRAKPEGTRAATLLAVADPVLPTRTAMQRDAIFRNGSFGPLPDSRAEVREIARLYGGSRVLIGNDATEAVVKDEADAFNVLHIATHGVINDAAPMYSAVLLSSSDAEDGLLEAREMIDMHLGADLAILSACQSAGSNVTPGEGLIGMSWALMVAGCRNTVVSQWNVASKSTAQLMIAFHREMSAHDYATALQRAQLSMLRTKAHRHPFHWSAFVLVATSQE